MTKCSDTLTNSGFTLIEILLAMALFTTVMLVSTLGFIGINRTYTRGMVRKQLSESVQTITDDLTRSLRAQSTKTDPDSCKEGCVPNGWSVLSFSNACYMWKVDDPSGGLYKAQKSCRPESADPSNRTGLLDERFMVHDLTVTSVSGGQGLFRVSGTFTTTDADALVDDHSSCRGTSQSPGVSTCAVENFNFIVTTSGAST